MEGPGGILHRQANHGLLATNTNGIQLHILKNSTHVTYNLTQNLLRSTLDFLSYLHECRIEW